MSASSLYPLLFEPTSHPFAIDDNGEPHSYSELSESISRFAKFLEPRQLVFMFCENDIGSLVGIPSLIQNNVVPLLLQRESNNDFVERLIKLYRPKYLYAPLDMQSRFPDWTLVLAEYGYVLLEKMSSESSHFHDDLAMLLTTSGSTGSPKLVRLSYTNLISNAIAIASYLKIESTDRPITTLPMNYSYGLSVINSHLLCGSTIVLTKSTIVEKKFWDAFQTHEATTLNGVPETFELLKKMRFFRKTVPSLKIITQAGGRLSESTTEVLIKYCAERGIDFFSMYGQTEASPRISYVPPDQIERKIGSIGIPIPGGEMSLIDDNGSLVNAENQSGELCYRGPNVFMGYSQSLSDLSKGDESMGFLRTGDIAYRDSDGFYFISGRKNRFIKIFGNRINLDDLEKFMSNWEGETVCTGVEDLVEIFTTSSVNFPFIVDDLARFTGLNRAAFRVHSVNAIPRSSSGKILYSDLKSK
jgi:long-chain acyl-CoA synthetase